MALIRSPETTRVFYKPNVDGRRTKTNPKTSPEQSAIFQLVREINETNATTCDFYRKLFHTPGGHFHDDWAKNVTSIVHVIQLTETIFELNSCIKETNTIFELVRDINKTNVLNNFHDDWVKIVTSSVFTRKTAPPTGGHVFQRTRTTFELNQHNHQDKHFDKHDPFNDDQTKNGVFTKKIAPPTGGHVFQWTRTTFELNQHIIKTNILTNFELDRDIIETTLLTNVYEQMLTDGRTDDGRTDGRTTEKDQSQKLT
ncbi:hypothetical protein DPMN_063501 [Dreissena polymorpha]|uniref:Uncharacterized protein n=1 Tax=Dreissena polymorpha TaxID=45954 RepID=A0A9D4CBJ9_DREPO|nr:hypothetical protein DPMN_063501 [Dreissena polymorpha]